MRQRIAQIVQHLRPGGLECLVLDLARHSRAPTTIIALEGTKDETLAAWPRLAPFAEDLVCLGKKAGRDLTTISRLSRVLKSKKITTVHTHHIGPLLYGGAAARFAMIDGLVHTEHDAWHLESPRRRLLEKASLRMFRPKLVADSNLVAERTAVLLGVAKPRIISNGVNTNIFVPDDQRQARERLGLPLDARIIGTAARLEHVKGVDLLVEAIAGLPDVVLAIAGDGLERQNLEARTEALGIRHRVQFLGRVDKMPQFYRALDRFCLPSRHEGLPLSILEAQSCGIPVIATDVGGVREAVDLESGVIAPHPTVPLLGDALARSISRVNGRSPRAFVENCYSLDIMMRQYEEIWHGREGIADQHLAAA